MEQNLAGPRAYFPLSMSECDSLDDSWSILPSHGRAYAPRLRTKVLVLLESPGPKDGKLASMATKVCESRKQRDIRERLPPGQMP